jgi:ubiquinone/menaquinone biosynthesis C-methylase UbiE
VKVKNMTSKSESEIRESYDRQAGSYTALLQNPDHAEHKRLVGAKLAAVLDQFSPNSLLDAGIGEASTTIPMLQAMQTKPRLVGFDISQARVEWANTNLRNAGFKAELFVGSLRSIDLPDQAVDVTVTFHAVEPNRGAEEVVLGELIRVSRIAVVMVEPSYELADEQQRARMDKFGYVRGLSETLDRLGASYTTEPWPLNVNPMNPAALTIIHPL